MNISKYYSVSLVKYVFCNISVFRLKKLSMFYIFTNKKYLGMLVSFLFLDFNSQAKIFSDVLAVDYPNKLSRFHLVYHLLSVLYHIRYFLFLWLSELEKVISLTSIFPCAAWYEREVWDLFGILFLGNLDLRRILTDYGFHGFPLRKDFPLTGFGEVYFDSLVECVLYRKSRLVQDYRFFDTGTPWDFYIHNKLV